MRRSQRGKGRWPYVEDSLEVRHRAWVFGMRFVASTHGLLRLNYALPTPRSVCIASTMSSQALAFSAGLRSRTLGW